MEAENIIIQKIEEAFPLRDKLTDEEIESNPYLLEESTTKESIAYLPTLMIYVLNNFRSDPQSMVYIQLIFALNEYSKIKSSNEQNIWLTLRTLQQKAILAFLGHLHHNQPANIDSDELHKIINRWKNDT